MITNINNRLSSVAHGRRMYCGEKYEQECGVHDVGRDKQAILPEVQVEEAKKHIAIVLDYVEPVDTKLL